MKHRLEKEIRSLEGAAERLIDSALKAGAQTVEVCGTYHHTGKITLEKQDFHLASSDSGYLLGVRVLKSDKQGFASSNSLGTTELKDTALKAVEIANISPGNPNFSIQPSSHVPKDAPVDDLWDDTLYDVSLQTHREWAKILYDEITKDKRFRLNEGSICVGHNASLVMNSLGTHKIEPQTQAIWSAMGMAVDGSNITSFDYFSKASRKIKPVPGEISKSVREFRESVVKSLKHGPAKSYRGVVAFAPRAMIDIFLSSINYHLNGRNVIEGTAQWGKADLGKKLLCDHFTLADIPWRTDRMGASFFDREGVPTADRIFVKKGELLGFMTDQYACRGLELPATGNAAGGSSAPPVVDSHCLVLEPGEKSLLELFGTAPQKELLMVHRFSGQTDPVTGDFSGVAKGAQWILGSEIVYFARETLISGNIFDAMKTCIGLSKEMEIVDSSEHSPYGFFDGISVTGGGTSNSDS